MIIFSSVTKKFGDTSPALDDISFSIDEGDLAVITGPSGSGKTSLMRLLTKEYTPTQGEITFHDTLLSDISTSQLPQHRRKIGVVFQDYKLLHDLNVWENIALALSIIGASPAETEKRVTDLLKLVDIVDKAFLFPSQLSGGEAQRVSIARALSTAPKVIFADEPTGNLDPETSKNIIKLLEKINKLGTTILVTTHDPVVLDVLGKARHLKLDKGKLIHDSKPSKKTTSKPESKSESVEDSQDDEQDKIEVDAHSENLDDDNQENETEEKQEKKSSKKHKANKKDADKTETSTKEVKAKKRVNLRIPSFLSLFKKSPKKEDDDETQKEEKKESDNE